MGYTNSPLVNHVRISPHKNSPRNHKIDTISIHCVVGQVTAERLGEVFADPARKASSNYGVDKDGRIGMYVEEKDRSWCTDSRTNDNRAVTIEVASDINAPYKVTDAALASLIELCADICIRNDIKQLLWKGNKSLIGKVSQQNMTVHRWFANKSCPGDYLYNLHGYIADEVNKRLAIASLLPKYNVLGNKYICDGVEYSLVFNPTYYADKYIDLKSIFGTDANRLFEHFIMFVMREGRQASSGFNLQAYKNRYSDLQKAFGDNLATYYQHYILFGYNEKRNAV